MTNETMPSPRSQPYDCANGVGVSEPKATLAGVAQADSLPHTEDTVDKSWQRQQLFARTIILEARLDALEEEARNSVGADLIVLGKVVFRIVPVVTLGYVLWFGREQLLWLNHQPAEISLAASIFLAFMAYMLYNTFRDLESSNTRKKFTKNTIIEGRSLLPVFGDLLKRSSSKNDSSITS